MSEQTEEIYEAAWRTRPACSSLNPSAWTEYMMSTYHDHETGRCACPHDPNVLHRDGVPWWEAEPHWWWQWCRPQSRGFGVERCSCGATRVDGFRGWIERRWRWR